MFISGKKSAALFLQQSSSDRIAEIHSADLLSSSDICDFYIC